MDFEVDSSRVLKAKIYGTVYDIKKPTVGTITQLNKKMKSVSEGSDEEQFSVMRDWMADLGLPATVTDDMEIEHFVALVEKLSGQKKS